eukprot:4489634-Amphidinium_carterae.1
MQPIGLHDTRNLNIKCQSHVAAPLGTATNRICEPCAVQCLADALDAAQDAILAQVEHQTRRPPAGLQLLQHEPEPFNQGLRQQDHATYHALSLGGGQHARSQCNAL